MSSLEDRSDDRVVDCANCGRQVVVEESDDLCYWCGKPATKSSYALSGKSTVDKKEVTMDRVNWEAMNRIQRSKYIKAHLTEIVEDIRRLKKKELLRRWPFGSSTYDKLKRNHTPELLRKPKTSSVKVEVKVDQKSDKVAELTEHERYLVLLGYQQATREFLESVRAKWPI